ncbi:MAG: hypothetical protein U0531_04645 [Dehalococcoidia bacterium]
MLTVTVAPPLKGTVCSAGRSLTVKRTVAPLVPQPATALPGCTLIW